MSLVARSGPTWSAGESRDKTSAQLRIRGRVWRVWGKRITPHSQITWPSRHYFLGAVGSFVFPVLCDLHIIVLGQLSKCNSRKRFSAVLEFFGRFLARFFARGVRSACRASSSTRGDDKLNRFSATLRRRQPQANGAHWSRRVGGLPVDLLDALQFLRH